MRYYNGSDDFTDYLEHHGVLGMKWGVRRYQNPDGSLTAEGYKHIKGKRSEPGYHAAGSYQRTRRIAKKDADEYAKAKAFYGQGAGNRRKAIKNTVGTRSKDDYYKKMFDEYSSNQDMVKRTKQAKRTRNALDVAQYATRTDNNKDAMVKAGMAAIGTVAVLHKTGLDKQIAAKGKQAYYRAKLNIESTIWNMRHK